MSSLGESSNREQRREERRRKRNAQDPTLKQTNSEKKDWNPTREERKNKSDSTASNGETVVQKKTPSGTKRLSYDKVNIIEKTPKFDTPAEKENKGKKENEENKQVTSTSASRRKLGSKFLDNLSKFETQAKQIEEIKKTPFVRSYSVTSQSSSINDSSFRRSYRPSRSTPNVEDPSILVRRSLRRERVLESIAKLEKQSTKTSSKKKPASDGRQKPDENKVKITSRPTSASSSKTSFSDSGSSTSSTKGVSRAQQALERHKNRMRKPSQPVVTPSPVKTPSSPSVGRSRSFSTGVSRKTPGKTKTKEPSQKLLPKVADESPTRKISVTKNPLDGDKVEITTVTEVMTSAEGKMSIVVKECAFSEEELEMLISPVDAPEYLPGDPRPMSVEDAVAIFDLEEDKPLSPVPTPEPVIRARRKLPEVPVQSTTKQRKHSKKKKKLPEDGSGEPCQNVVVIETSPIFQYDIPQEISSPNFDKKNTSYNFNQNSSNIESNVMKHDQKPLEHNQKSLERENKSTKYDQNSLKHDEKSLEHDQNSLERKKKLPKYDQNLLKHGQKLLDCDQQSSTVTISTTAELEQIQPITVESEPVQVVLADDQPMTLEQETTGIVLEKNYNPEEAIQALRRLSKEIHSQPVKSNDHSSKKKSPATSSFEEEIQTQDFEIDINKKHRSKKKKKDKRPTSLHIEEVLYISDDIRPKSTSPIKPSPKRSELTKTPYPVKSPKSGKKHRKSSSKSPTHVKDFIRETPSPEIFILPQVHLQKSPVEVENSKITLEAQIKTPGSPKRSLPKIPISKESSGSPTNSPSYETKPLSPLKTQELPSKEPGSPKIIDSKPLSPLKKTKSPTKSLESPIIIPNIETKPSSPLLKVQESPIKTLESPLKAPESPLKTPESPLKLSDTQEEVERKASPTVDSQIEIKMIGSKKIAPRITKTKKTWLDDSDSDETLSLLSDAGSDASDIDLDWLGTDSEDEIQPDRVTKLRSGSSGIQRTASKAQDMLKLWEKKAVEPALKMSPARQPGKLGSTITSWQNKSTSSSNGISDRSSESINEDAEKRDNVSLKPTTPVHRSASLRNNIRSASTSDWKPKEEENMQDIFDARVAGKILGAKALFENLTQSPVRSPTIPRSPRRQIEVKQSRENSPVFSRKSSVDEPTSRKSSSSNDSSSSDANESSDGAEEPPKVDNMRAMFEKQANKKREFRKQKTFESAGKKTKGTSNIQKKVAARKKGRRSMTQPITTDDVMKAETIMNGSDKVDSEAEEEPLNFKDRLKFFAQLSSKRSTQPKSRVRRRSNTQPIKSTHIEKAAELLETNQAKREELRPTSANSEKKSTTVKSTPVPSLSNPTRAKKFTRNISITSSSDNDSLLSSSSTSFDDSEPGGKRLLLSSSEETSSSVEMSVHIAEIKSVGSIHERQQRLQRNNTEEKSKKENRNSEIKSSVSDRLNKLKSQEDRWKKAPVNDFATRAEKLSERIAKIKEDSKTWKAKTGKQNDAAQFTVQAKLAKREGKKAIAVLPSPTVKRRVLPVSLPTKAAVVTVTDTKHHRQDSASMNQLSFVEKLASKGLEENVLKTTEIQTTEVPEFDHEEFEKFFGTSSEVLTNGDAVDIDIDTLPEVKTSSKLSDIGRLKSSVQQQNKRKSSARNPLKALAARTDIKQSYETSRSNIGKLEQQRIAVRGYGANFTSAALAGLASKADLKSVNLRSTKNTPMPSNDDLKPFKDVMLLRAKGRRQVQTRLVDPCPASLSSDDAFLLITPNKLFGWFGEFCNVIERAKINEIADYIVMKGDLGCKVSQLKTIEEICDQTRYKEFWDFLGGNGEWDKTTQQGLDEQYEVDVEATIKTYKMIDAKLIPHEEAWGKFPKMSMLGSSDTFVFDFGAEMYIWQGKEVSFADRRLAVRLARVIWEQDYDFTEQGVCPFHAKQLKGMRPKFGLFARVNENLETSLFQEKFEDWSNIHREIGDEEANMRETSRGKADEEQQTKSSIVSDLEAYDVTKMEENKVPMTSLLIEGCDVANGDGDIVDDDGRILEIITLDVETYHVTESNVEKFTDSVLHRSNTYFVKWKYSISSTGRFEKSKEGKPSASESCNGRQRVAYFSWAGPDSPASEKGTSALIASSMDTDDGPIINVDEATALPVFNKCFNGNLVIMDGKRGVKRGAFNWRLFEVKGESTKSAALVEVSCENISLRSCSSFITFLPRDATAIVWHGCRSSKNVRDAAEGAINKMSGRMPDSIPFRKNPTCLNISICEEGEEPEKFWEAIGIKRRNRYECLLDVDSETRITRAWKFVIQSELIFADELKPVNNNTSFPLVQAQLFEVETPSLILLDSTHGVFLWQNCDSEKLGGSAKRRWDVIRRLSIETTINYCKEYKREEAKLIEAGSEPTSITNAFQCWKVKEKTALEKSISRKPRLVSEILSTLSRLTYSLKELSGPELPDGVDASHLESYLTNTDFENLFKMTKKEFYQIPVWKQKKIRQEKKFF